MKIKSILNLSFFILFFSNSLSYLQAMQTEASSNLVCIDPSSPSITKPSIKERFTKYSKEKSKEMLEWVKKNKALTIALGTIITIATAAIITKKLKERKGEEELRKSYHDISSEVIKHHLVFKNLVPYEIKIDPFEMNSIEIDKFLKDRNLANQPAEVGKSYLESGPRIFHYNYIKVGNNLYFYSKK